MRRKNIINLTGKHMLRIDALVVYSKPSKREYIRYLKGMVATAFWDMEEDEVRPLIMDDQEIGTVWYEPSYSLGEFVLYSGGKPEKLEERPTLIIEFHGMNFGGRLYYQPDHNFGYGVSGTMSIEMKKGSIHRY